MPNKKDHEPKRDMARNKAGGDDIVSENDTDSFV